MFKNVFRLNFLWFHFLSYTHKYELFYFTVKLPQVIKVWKSKSAVGISLINVSMDLFAVTANVVYSYSSQFPFR